MFLKKPFARGDGYLERSHEQLTALAYASTGKSAPKKLEIPKIFVGDKNYTTQYSADQPFREIDSPAKVLMEINDESPTNYVAKKLVGLLNTSH